MISLNTHMTWYHHMAISILFLGPKKCEEKRSEKSLLNLHFKGFGAITRSDSCKVLQLCILVLSCLKLKTWNVGFWKRVQNEPKTQWKWDYEAHFNTYDLKTWGSAARFENVNQNGTKRRLQNVDFNVKNIFTAKQDKS